MTYSMRISLCFDRPVDLIHDYISPGGYEFISCDKSIHFDFETSYGFVDSEVGNKVGFDLFDPDVSTFPDCTHITPNFVRNISKIEELYLFIDDSRSCGSLNLVSVDCISFQFTDTDKQEVETVVIHQAVLDDYNRNIEVLRRGV